MDMDVLSIAVSAASQKTVNNIGGALLGFAKKQMDQQAEDVKELFSSLEKQVNPHVGGNVDVQL